MNNDNLNKDEEIMEVDDLELNDIIFDDITIEAEESDHDVSEGDSEEELETYEPSKFESIEIKTNIRGSIHAGVMSIVNSKGCGMRVTISKEVAHKIGDPKSVTIGFGENEISILMAPLNSHNAFKLGRVGAKGVIYSKSLVNVLTDRYDLDFNDRVSITFDKVEYKADGDKIVAVIAMV